MTERASDAARAPGSARPDASMDLLRQIVVEAVDPDYARAARSARRSRSRVWGLVGALVTCALLVAAVVQHAHGEPSDQAQRVQLAHQVTVLQAEIKAKKRASADSTVRSPHCRRRSFPPPRPRSCSRPRSMRVSPRSPVRAIVVTCDDSPQAQTADGRVADTDLRVLVNGLWEAGAEAIAINGQRITATSAIRSAGSAITVNYTSLIPPYRVVVLGDPATLPVEARDGARGCVVELPAQQLRPGVVGVDREESHGAGVDGRDTAARARPSMSPSVVIRRGRFGTLGVFGG